MEELMEQCGESLAILEFVIDGQDKWVRAVKRNTGGTVFGVGKDAKDAKEAIKDLLSKNG